MATTAAIQPFASTVKDVFSQASSYSSRSKGNSADRTPRPIPQSTANVTSTTTEVKNGIVSQEISMMCAKHLRARPGIKRFYPEEKDFDQNSTIVTDATKFSNFLLANGCSREIACMMSLLTLYDLVMLIDDSISMELRQNGERIKTLQETMEQVARVYWHASKRRGVVSVRFLNSNTSYRNVRPSHIKQIIQKAHFGGDTPIGTQLEKKILNNYVSTDSKMKRPLIVVVITDGEVEGEPKDYLRRVIVSQATRLLSAEPEIGHHAVSYQFAKIGDDEEATELVRRLDDDEFLSPYIDCMHAELEQLRKAEEEKSNEKWKLLGKLLLGGVDEFFDELVQEERPDSDGSDDNLLPKDQKQDEGEIDLGAGDDADDDAM